MGQCHTSRDVLRKAPREQGGELSQEPLAPSRSTTTRAIKQDISLEGMPELLLSIKLWLAPLVRSHTPAEQPGEKGRHEGGGQGPKERCGFATHKDPGEERSRRTRDSCTGELASLRVIM